MSCCDKKECKENEEKYEAIDRVMYVIAIIVFLLTFILHFGVTLKIIMYISTILLAGYEIIFNGIRNILKFNFKEDTLMTIAIIAACILGEFIEGCLIVLLFKLGEIIEDKAVDNSNRNISKIVQIKSKNANLIENEEVRIVDTEKLNIGDIILIKPGERIPTDCVIISGEASIDTSSLTGESIPVIVKEGKELLSGYVNLDGSLTCRVIRDYKHSAATQIVDLVYEAQNNKGKTEKFITKFSKIYTPVVIVLAILIAIIPIIVGLDLKVWLMRALVFLVASCPCSIIISIPLALYSCIGAISKRGMLIKGTKHIEDLAQAKIIGFDKTGTITTGNMKIEEIKIFGDYTILQVLEYIYNMESNSSHPIASAIENKIKEDNLQNSIVKKQVYEYREIAGCGICGKIDEKNIIFGNKKLLSEYKIKCEQLDINKNYLVIDEEIVATVTLSEQIRKGVDKLIKNLTAIGIHEKVMLTGDNEKNAKIVAQKVGINKIYAGLLPKQKLEKVEELKKNGKVIFIGDGINDSPVLASADFSISIGDGTEIANNTADSILISNNLNSITEIIKLSRKTMHILKGNIIFSILIKLIVLILGLLGFAPISLAVLADVGVTLITVLNAIRIR